MSDAHRDEIAKLEALYAENPEGRIFTHLAEAYRKAGELDLAQQVLEQGIERHPDYSSAHVVLGRVLMDQGRHDEADAEFRRVLEFDGQNLVALRSLGLIAREQGRAEAAIEYFERLLDLDPSSDETREALAELRGEAPVSAGEPVEPAEAGAAEVGPETGEEVAAGAVAGLEPTSADASEEPAGEVERLEGFEETEAGAEAGAGADDIFEDAPWATGAEEEEEEEAEWVTGPAGAEAEPPDTALEEWESEWAGEPAEAGAEPEVAEPEVAEPEVAEPWAEAAEGDEWAEPVEAEARRGPDAEPLDEEAAPWAVEPEAEAGEEAGEPVEAEAGVGGEEGGGERADTPPLPDEPGVMTETFAHVYARQGLYERAAEVYRELVRSRPDDDSLRARLAEMEAMAARTAGAGEVPEEAAVEGLEPMEVETEAKGGEPLPGLEPEEVDAETGLAAGLTGKEAVPEAVPDAVDVRDVPQPPEAAGWADTGEDRGEGPEISPWTAGDWSSPDEETPYAWTDDESEADTSEPIRHYFAGLLGWQGRGERAGEGPADQGEPEAAQAGPSTGMPYEDAGEGEGATAVAGEPEPDAGVAEPEAAVESGPEAAVEPEPGAGVAESEAPVEPEPEGGIEPAAGGEREPGPPEAGPDDDDDLDMFRSWLESLKR